MPLVVRFRIYNGGKEAKALSPCDDLIQIIA